MTNSNLPPHLACLVPSEWAIWRWFVLRGAGFPASPINRLAASHCASVADHLISAQNALEDQFQSAIRKLNAVLDRFTAEGKNKEDPGFKAVLNARRRLADRKVPGTVDSGPEFGEAIGRIEELMQQARHLHAQFEASFAEWITQQSKMLQAFASGPQLQEAIIWQNRQAYETAIQPMTESASGHTRNQHQRHHEELIASYIQRYLVKNDTIGFFGPVAWGRIEEGKDLLDAVYGDTLLKRRNTYFEDWAIEKVAASLSQLEGILWWVPPRLVSHAFIKDGILHQTGVPALPLNPLDVAVLQLCDGKNLPGDILGKLHHQPEFQGVSPEDLRKLLETRTTEGVITWCFLVPVEVNAEKGLRQQLLRVGDAELRHTSLNYLDQLEALRRQVAGSTGNPAQLCDALRALDQNFAAITKTESHRKAGATYGGRTIVYEDCRRNATVKISPELLAPAVPALSLLLRGYRWLVQSMAKEFNSLFRSSYREFAAAHNAQDVPLMDWWLFTEPRLMESPAFSQLESVFKHKWTEILPIAPERSLVRFESSQLQEMVGQSFSDPGVACPVRYFCPDMLLAGTPESIQRGDCLYVLGEMHLARNSLIHTALVEQHPRREDLEDAVRWDFSGGRFKIIETQESGTTTLRPTDGLRLPEDYYLATTPLSATPTGCDGHPFSALQVHEQDGEVLVTDRKEGRCFHILDAFADLFCSFVMNRASWREPSHHVPRVLIDNVVIHRETWRASVTELAFAMEKEESRRFLGARKWMKSRGLPRKTFVKSPVELKPFYLDLDSPILVEIFCRTVRRLNASSHPEAQITMSEMLPDTDQLWLQDASGATYTSELRFAIVDLALRERGSYWSLRFATTRRHSGDYPKEVFQDHK